MNRRPDERSSLADISRSDPATPRHDDLLRRAATSRQPDRKRDYARCRNGAPSFPYVVSDRFFRKTDSNLNRYVEVYPIRCLGQYRMRASALEGNRVILFKFIDFQ